MGDAAGLLGVRPVLPVAGVDEVSEYYRRRLGFVVLALDREKGQARYALLRRGEAEIHLQWQSAEDLERLDPTMVQLRFECADVEALLADFVRRGAVGADAALRDTPWGTREFAFYDPFGFGLTFYQDRS